MLTSEGSGGTSWSSQGIAGTSDQSMRLAPSSCGAGEDKGEAGTWSPRASIFTCRPQHKETYIRNYVPKCTMSWFLRVSSETLTKSCLCRGLRPMLWAKLQETLIVQCSLILLIAHLFRCSSSQRPYTFVQLNCLWSRPRVRTVRVHCNPQLHTTNHEFY